jgi:hypothetical protein
MLVAVIPRSLIWICAQKEDIHAFGILVLLLEWTQFLDKRFPDSGVPD